MRETVGGRLRKALKHRDPRVRTQRLMAALADIDGFARRYSSLGVADFVRTMTVQELSVEGLRAIGPIATTLAALEGLDAHAWAVNERLASLGELQ